jgi:hypothetical protein
VAAIDAIRANHIINSKSPIPESMSAIAIFQQLSCLPYAALC